MTIKKSRKRVVSILLILTLLLSLMPAAAFAADTAEYPEASNVFVDGGKSFYNNRLYYKKGDQDKNFTGNEGDYIAHYNPATGTLTLNGYSGGSISVGGVKCSDITVVLKGTNTINGSLENAVGGDITVTSSDGGTLSISETTSGSNSAIGIETGLSASYTTGNVTIKGNAKVTINMTHNGTSTYEKAYGIFAKENITISENASVDITCATPNNTTGGGNCNGLYAAKDVTIDTNGTIKIDVTNAGRDKDNGYSYGVYHMRTATLTKVGNMEVQWKKEGNSTRYSGGAFTRGATFSDTDHAINEDTTNCYASYRYGTSYYTVTAGNGKLTGPGVKYPNGNGKFLVGDTVNIKPNEKKSSDGTLIPFKEWTSEGVALASPTTPNTSFNVPTNDVTVTATYNPFDGAPVFTRTSDSSGTIKFKTVANPDNSEFFEYVKDGETAYKRPYSQPTTTSSASPYEYSVSVSTYYAGDIKNLEAGDYRMAVTLNGERYLSDPFTVDYTATPVPKELTSIEITTPPTNVEYTEGESFDPTGMVVTAKYSDNTSNPVTSYTCSPDGALSTSDSSITVSYTEGGVAKTATQAITVKAAPLGTVVAPSFAPSEKTFAYTVDVTLTTATEDADIYYTLDDSDPTVTSTKYTSAITLTDTTTIKAIAVKTGMTDSTISTAIYTKQAPSAEIKDVTISGKLNTTLTKDVTITLTNDTFKDLNVGQSVASWFNLPQALIAKIKSINTDKNSIVITIDGTPTEACDEQIAVSIPAMRLESGKDLTVTPNSNAKYNIAAADTYQLNITLGKNMTASGTLSQNITATHAMTAVTVKADSGYYFPENYANLGMLSGVTVARVDATTLTISGTPSMSRNINLADATALLSVALPAAATGLVYNGDEQASGIAENAGYTLTGELKGTAAKDYLATATLNDGYVWSDGNTDKARDIKWSIAKADITATAPTAKTKLIYNGKAQDLITAGTTDFGDWQYKVNDGAYGPTIPQGTNAATYRVYFKIDGDDNHNAVSEKYFDVTIDKADPDYEVPTDLKGYQGRALSTVNLPGGWSWKDGSERMSKTGNQTFKATFTPNDIDNYNIIENIDVTVNVRSTALPGGAAQTEFGITAPKADNGSIGISQKEASAGTTIIVSLTPAEGYKAGSLTVTDKNGNKLTLKSAGENKYTFTMPNSAVDIKANFVKADGSSTVDPKTAIIMQIGNLHMTVNGKAFTNDVAPVIMNDRTLVPIRVVTETFGGSADWNALTKEVTLNLDGKTIKMTVGQTINKYGVAPMIIDGRTYVPIRFVADELGAVTTWINATRTVVIEK